MIADTPNSGHLRIYGCQPSICINSKGMFFGRANLDVQKAINSLAAAPPFLPADSNAQFLAHDQTVLCLRIVARSDLQNELCTASFGLKRYLCKFALANLLLFFVVYILYVFGHRHGNKFA